MIADHALPLEIENVFGCFLNFQYKDGKLLLTTGTSLKIFTMDKSLDRVFDEEVRQFLLKNAGKYGLTFSKHIFGLLLRVRSGRPLHIYRPTRGQLNRSCTGSGEVQRRHAYDECPQKFRQTDP